MSSLIIRIPQFAPNCIRQSMASSNASHMHQNFSSYSDLVRYVFGLRTSQGCIIGEVYLREMVKMIVGLQSLTLKCIARVSSLKSSLEKLLTISRGNVGLYSVGKRMRKSTLKKFRAVSFVCHSQFGLSHEMTRKI